MKFCVSGRQMNSVLTKADEIKMQYKDRDRLLDYVEQYPDKTFILEVPRGTESLDWNLYKAYSEKVNFVLCIQDLALSEVCRENGVKFYWYYPCFTWYELDSLIALEPCYIMIGAPLCFDLVKIKQKTEIPLRMIANVAHDSYIPRKDGICGGYIRPEDVDTYAHWIRVLEFKTEEISQEATLLRIYQEEKKWNGNLTLLLTNLNYPIDNRAIPEDFATTRITCGQRCMERGTCHYCWSAFKFANVLRKEHYRRQKEEALARAEEN